ncbi:MAG: hypothetical protein IE923_00235 [Micrococcales bacterium]|nr:hypothetical protein [Micrococcales bacterium]
MPGTSGHRLIELLEDAARTLRNVQGAAYDAVGLFNAYLSWASDQVRMLAPAVSRGALDELVTTRRHWALHALDPATKGRSLAGIVNTEIEQQARLIDAARNVLVKELGDYVGVDRILVPDTNVYLHVNARFDELDWRPVLVAAHRQTRVVVPLIVLDELDRAKRRSDKVDADSKESVRTRARATLKALEERLLPLERAEPLDVVTYGLHVERAGHVRLPDADSEVIDQARALRDLTGLPLAILTGDTGMRVRAAVSGVETVPVPGQWVVFGATA